MTLAQTKIGSNKSTRNWRSHGSPLALLVGSFSLAISSFSLSACSDTNGENSSDGALHGELHIYRINYLDGHSEREFYLAPNDETPADTRLIFRGDPLLDPWTRIRVWGTSTPDGFKVARYETEPVDDDVASASAAITNPTKQTRTVGFVITDPSGSGTVNLTNANAQTAIFGTRTATQAGLNQYYTEVSYGGLSFSGEILGPVTVTTLGTCQQSAITQIEKGWSSQFGKTFQHWMTYLGQNYSSCGWSGIGGEGTAARPASGSWYNASTGCTVLAQEVGHNLGMMHSNSLRCSGGVSFVDDPLSCTGAEYGNRHSVMGSGCAHLTAYDKWYEGFFQGCNAVRATASGTYTLLPTETPCDGVQALQIPMPKTRPFRNTQGVNTTVNLNKYYLELRTKTGIDANEAAPTVLVMVGNEVPAPSKYSEFTWVLDMNPSTTNAFDGMGKGQTFTDPAGGVGFTVTELDASHATIDVTVANSSGGPTCMDGSTFAPPGPGSCGTSAGMGGSSGTGGSSGMGGSTASGGTSAGGKTGSGGNVGSGGKVSGGSGGTNAGGSMNRGGATGNAGSNNAGGRSSSSGGSNNGGSTNGGNAGSNNGGATNGGSSAAGSNNAGSNNNGGNAGSTSAGASNTGNGGSGNGGSANGSGGANAAGSPPTAGNNSAGNGNTAGASTAHGGSSNTPPPDVGGCSCRTAPNDPHRSAWGLAGLLGIGLAARRRRR
jgi:MYXO-CTERM domain-containing protein